MLGVILLDFKDWLCISNDSQCLHFSGKWEDFDYIKTTGNGITCTLHLWGLHILLSSSSHNKEEYESVLWLPQFDDCLDDDRTDFATLFRIWKDAKLWPKRYYCHFSKDWKTKEDFGILSVEVYSIVSNVYNCDHGNIKSVKFLSPKFAQCTLLLHCTYSFNDSSWPSNKP